MLGSLSSNFLLGFILLVTFLLSVVGIIFTLNSLYRLHSPTLPPPLQNKRLNIRKSAKVSRRYWKSVDTSPSKISNFLSPTRFSQHIYLDHLSVFICLFSPLIVVIEIVKNQLLLKSFFFGINFGFRRLLFS